MRSNFPSLIFTKRSMGFFDLLPGDFLLEPSHDYDEQSRLQPNEFERWAKATVL